MNKAILLSAVLIFASCSHQSPQRIPAQASEEVSEKVVQYTCLGIYEMALARQLESKEKYNQRYNRRGDNSCAKGRDCLPRNASWGTVAFWGAGFATGSLPVAVVMGTTPFIISAVKNRDSKEEKALALQDESSKRFKKFLAKLQKKISPQITDEEVHEIMQEGFDSGLYCENLPKLASEKNIRKQITDVLKERYIPNAKK